VSIIKRIQSLTGQIKYGFSENTSVRLENLLETYRNFHIAALNQLISKLKKTNKKAELPTESGLVLISEYT